MVLLLDLHTNSAYVTSYTIFIGKHFTTAKPTKHTWIGKLHRHIC